MYKLKIVDSRGLKLRRDIVTIFHAALGAVDPIVTVQRHVRRRDNGLEIRGHLYDLSAYEKIYVVGAGKASAAMAMALEDLLGNRLKAGVVNVKIGHTLPLNIVKVNEASHPVPDRAGLQGTREIIKLLRQTGKRDLVFCLISGGGSALLPSPAEGVTLQDKQQLTRHLMECGANIHEINTLRKHVSGIKGGRLAQLAYPSTLISLILSDVIGDDLDTIASGPTVPDRSTFVDCLRILEKYQAKGRIPSQIKSFLEKGAASKIEETPKEDDPAFQRTQNVIIASNILAVKAAKEKAEELGYHSLILSSMIEGETRDVAKVHAAIAKEILKNGHPLPGPACLISGGETTVTIRGPGLGGRNQEFALAAALEIEGLEEIVLLSGGTDGTDGPTDAAGAIADGQTIKRAGQLGLDAEQFLRQNDSYRFFQPLGDLLMTGPTLTNVMDLRLILTGN